VWLTAEAARQQVDAFAAFAGQLRRVEIAPTRSDKADPEPLTPTLPPVSDQVPRPNGLIEVVLTSGATLRVDAMVDAAALGRVMAALDRR
jgi:hypothetical protein